MKKFFCTIISLIAICSSTMAFALDSTSPLGPIKTKQFLMVSYLLDPTTPFESIAPLVKGEAQLAWSYYSMGRIRQMYARSDATGMVILWEAKNIADAKNAISQMPMVKANFIGFNLYPVTFFNSLSSLFDTNTQVSQNVTTIAKSSQFVLITRKAQGVTDSQISALDKEESLAVWQNYQTGLFSQMFDRENKVGGAAIILRADNIDDARAIVNELPLIKNKLIDYDLIPVHHFFPFEALF